MSNLENVPLIAVLTEFAVGFLTMWLASISFSKYKKRKNTPLLNLTLLMVFYSIAAWISGSGKFIEYFIDNTSIDYALFMSSNSYIFISIGNIFLYMFTEEVFLSNNEFRKIIFAVLNGMTIGGIIFLNSLQYPENPKLTLILIYLILVTSITAIILIYASVREFTRTNEKITKIGFIIIAIFGLFIMFMFLFFILDNVKIQLTDIAYNPEYYIGWIFAFFAILFAHIGYNMPQWFRKLIGE